MVARNACQPRKRSRFARNRERRVHSSTTRPVYRFTRRQRNFEDAHRFLMECVAFLKRKRRCRAENSARHQPAPARSGSALLELAVAIPILLLFTMGVVDYARVYFASIAVANATMAGAQYGAP